jgi:hypothetical protein
LDKYLSYRRMIFGYLVNANMVLPMLANVAGCADLMIDLLSQTISAFILRLNKMLDSGAQDADARKQKQE